MTTKHFSHIVQIPFSTNVEEMMGCYRTLLNVLGIPNEIPFLTVDKFTHPIPEENAKLTADYMNTMNLLQSMLGMKDFRLENLRVTQHSAVFVFAYEE